MREIAILSSARARASRFVVVTLLLAVAGCGSWRAGGPAPAGTRAAAMPPPPEAATGRTAKPGWQSQRFMVAAANPLAAQAGYAVLRDGGTAVDAAVAVQMVLALVEPQSSGLGGGAFLLHAQSGAEGTDVVAWDGRETAPAAADERLLLLPDGRPMPFAQAVVGGRAVGTPGTVRMLEAAHRAHGRLPWARLLAPAIRLAEEGFAISPRLHMLLSAETTLQNDARAAAYFFAPDGQPWPVGHTLRNPALAAVLKAIAARGSDALHRGPVAQDIVSRVRSHPTNPGLLSAADLAGYEPLRRVPLCALWLARWQVCGFPPPSSGHLAVMQILGLLEQAGATVPSPSPSPAQPVAGSAPLRDRAAATQGVPGADWLHTYVEASRLAWADRAAYVADPAFVPAPAGRWDSLLEPAYLERRAALLGPARMPAVEAGNPGGKPLVLAPMPAQPEAGTSHLGIVDGEGRAVAMTSSIESAFGARLMSDGGTGLRGGFLLNNQLTDFSFAPTDTQGRPVANRVQPGKRPRSSMSPTLVFDAASGRVVMTVGSAGGAAIVHHTARTLLATLAWGQAPQPSLDAPNFAFVGGPVLLERGGFPVATADALRRRGHAVEEAEMTSGLHLIQRGPQGWRGAADPRREGIAMGE